MKKTKDIILFIFLLICGLVLVAGSANAAANKPSSAKLEASSTPQPATAEQLAIAYAEWAESSHSDTYDEGYGANTTCARCKAPQNWDIDNKAQESALDCFSCKRIPGEARPELSGGVTVPQNEWMSIGCDVCHQPIGDSYAVEITFWDQANQVYVQVENTNELCAKCHEGKHGFHVIEEQEISPAHNQWECNECHGNHGAAASCIDCHDPSTSSGALEHARHPSVNCTACHDAGGLTIWLDDEPSSNHSFEYIPLRFAHDLTSWPSHNLSKEVDCTRCHHPGNIDPSVLVQDVSCNACHTDGASLFWCDFFYRDENPNADPLEKP